MANQKTFLPQLLKIAHMLCRYMQRYETFIKSFLDEDQQAIFDAALAACHALDVMLETVIPDLT